MVRFFLGSFQHIQDVCGSDLLDRQHTDFWKNDALQHVEAALLGHLLPVLHGYPLAGYRLEGGRTLLYPLDFVELTLMGGVDALLDQGAGFDPLFSCFCQCEPPTGTPRHSFLCGFASRGADVLADGENALL